LFKWKAEKDERPVVENLPDNLFFARQKINNACATQAILSILLNAPDRIQLGDELSQFLEFTRSFAPDLRGDAIGNSEVMRLAHNSFARPEPFVMEEDKRDDKEDEAFHFISYVPVNGTLYELDGLKRGPVILSECDNEDDFLNKVVPVIQERISRYAQNEIKFNLLAVIGDPSESHNKEIVELNKQLEGNVDEHTRSAIQSRINELKEKLLIEAEKSKNWREENIRRRHNYVPFLVNLLKVLAQKNELMPLVQAAKTKQQQNQQGGSKK
jgi:ubiquitin carboxyl-terminal hydrolase L5